MSSNITPILADPHPCRHIVYSYEEDDLAIDRVALFAESGLQRGEGVILVLTAAHWGPIVNRLRHDGFDIDALQHSGQLVAAIAEDLLVELLVDGFPQEARFRELVGRVIATCRTKAGGGRVRVYGEMVSLMWNLNLEATVALEEMWNRLIETHNISLLCGYALKGRDAVPARLHELHSDSAAN